MAGCPGTSRVRCEPASRSRWEPPPAGSVRTSILRARFRMWRLPRAAGLRRCCPWRRKFWRGNRYLGRFAVHFAMSREPQQTAVLNGRIDGAKVRELARRVDGVAAADEYFVCGPCNMVEEVRAAIKDINGNAPVRC